MNKKNLMIFLVLSVFLISMIYAVGEASYCCEKTENGRPKKEMSLRIKPHHLLFPCRREPRLFFLFN